MRGSEMGWHDLEGANASTGMGSVAGAVCDRDADDVGGQAYARHPGRAGGGRATDTRCRGNAEEYRPHGSRREKVHPRHLQELSRATGRGGLS